MTMMMVMMTALITMVIVILTMTFVSRFLLLDKVIGLISGPVLLR